MDRKLLHMQRMMARKQRMGIFPMRQSNFGFNNNWSFVCGVYEDPERTIFVPKWREIIHNLVVLESLEDVLDVYFKSGSQSATWYIGLFSSDSTPASGWTYAVPTFTEFTNYDEATREEWVEGSISSAILDNSSSPAEFTCTSGSNIIRGAFMCNISTKGDTAGGGILFSAARFSADRPFNSGEVIKIVISVNTQNV